jgi:hypothetical protein
MRTCKVPEKCDEMYAVKDQADVAQVEQVKSSRSKVFLLSVVYETAGRKRVEQAAITP